MKKLLFTFLAALCCTVMAFANGIKINNIYYILDDENLTATVTYGGTNEAVSNGTSEYKGSITIPSTVSYNSKDYKVTSIGDYAFRNCDTRMGEPLISVTIPEGVTSIGTYAFYSCSSMTSVIIPSTITSIGDGAFTICHSLTLMFQGDIPGILADDLFNYFWFQIGGTPLPKVVVCDKYEDNYTYFSAKGHTIVSLSDFKAQVLIKITEAQENVGNLTEQEFATIESCRSAIESATTPGDVFTNKEIALLTINLSPSKQDAIATLNNLVKNKVGLDIRRYITAINNATSEEQITEILNNATEEINNSKTFTVGDKMYYLNNIGPDYTFYGNITFNDKDFYQSDYDFTVDGSITYNRTFSNTNWQALYVPFSMDFSEWSEYYDIAEINNFIEYDDDGNGVFDRTYLVVLKKTSGSTEPNYPYLIRAKSEGTHSLVLTDKTLEAAACNSIDCSSVKHKYTFTGTYQPITTMYANGYYAMDGGKLQQCDAADVVLGAQRWYMAITSRTGDAPNKSHSIRILVDGEDTTEIEALRAEEGASRMYDLSGRMVDKQPSAHGVYIDGGKKIIK